MMIFADVSSNNGPNIDLSAYARAGYRRIAIKATEGTGYLNPYMQAWRAKARGLQLEVWLYHFARPGIDGTAEARYFLSKIGGLLPGEVPVIDIEGSGWLGSEAADDLKAFAATVKVPGYCYASESFIGDEGLWLPPGWKWWVAKYASTPPRQAWSAWQYDQYGSAPGLGNGTVDLSRYEPTPQGDDVQVPTLRPGAKGRQVFALQTILNGYMQHLGIPRSAHNPLTVDGVFGANTQGALQDVQRKWGDLTDFGVCTPHVWWMFAGQYGPDPKGAA